MRSKRGLILLGAAFAAVFYFPTLATPLFAADKSEVLYSFFCTANGCPDGQEPSGGMVFDTAGNLYGTTFSGGVYSGAGTVFQLVPGANGTWTENVLYAFCAANQCSDGSSPTSGVITDAAGNLYGTTYLGGAYGNGTVFQLAPGANGKWTERVLYSFCAALRCTDGSEPFAGLIFDAAGNLYGTTFLGGSGYGLGTVFQLARGADGKWTEKVLHRFGIGKDDGYWPSGGLTFDSAGALYGATRNGGAHVYYGTVFRLKCRADGTLKAAWSSMRLGTCTGQRCLAVPGAQVATGMAAEPSSSWHQVLTASGRRPYCTASTIASVAGTIPTTV